MTDEKTKNEEPGKKGKKGRKSLSISYVFGNKQYLNIIFLIYYCTLFRKKQKKKFLKQVLIKNQFSEFGYTTKEFDSSYYFPQPEYATEIISDDLFGKYKKKRRSPNRKNRKETDLWSIEEVVIHRTAITVYTIILQEKIRLNDLGFLNQEELEKFKSITPEQFYYDNLFDTDKQLTKGLGSLKNRLQLINNYHDARGTYWDLTLRGFQEIQKRELLLQIDDLFQHHYAYYEENKGKIDTLLTPVFPPIVSWVPSVPWESVYKEKNSETEE